MIILLIQIVSCQLFYLTNRYQWAKANNSYNLWSSFNIFLCDIFFLINVIGICKLCWNSTSYSIGKNEYEPEKNYKRHQPNLLTGPTKRPIKQIKINMIFCQVYIWTIKLHNRKLMYKKLLGVTTDKKLNFNEFVSNAIDTISRENSSTRKNFPVTILNAYKQFLMITYFMSHFGYCHLVWMNHNRIANKCSNGLHKRVLKLVNNSLATTRNGFLYFLETA